MGNENKRAERDAKIEDSIIKKLSPKLETIVKDQIPKAINILPSTEPEKPKKLFRLFGPTEWVTIGGGTLAFVFALGIAYNQISTLSKESEKLDGKIDKVDSKYDAKFEKVNADYQIVRDRLVGIETEVKHQSSVK